MRQQNRFQRQGGECVLSVTSGGFRRGGAEKTPAEDYSINTWQRMNDARDPDPMRKEVVTGTLYD
jgi:hypothetical protein